MVTEFGVVKRTAIEEYRNIRRSGLNAINLDEGDHLISVSVTTGNQDILIGTKSGIAIRFNENDARLMKRAAHGVRGIKLNAGDVVVGAGVLNSDESEAQVFTISEEGFGKRNDAEAYTLQKRGGKGSKTSKLRTKLVM